MKVSSRPLDGRRVLLLCSFDSFVKSVSQLRRLFERNGAECVITVIRVRNNQISAHQRRLLDLDPAAETRSLNDIFGRGLDGFDIVVAALEGTSVRQFFARFQALDFARSARRPVVVCLNPGIVFRFLLRTLSERAEADCLLLNSKADLEAYGETCRAIGADPSNALWYGLPIIGDPGESEPAATSIRGRSIVFFDQVAIPSKLSERRYVVHRLIALARRFPNTPMLIKPRVKRGEITVFDAIYHIEDLIEEARRRGGLPANLKVVHTPIGELFDEMALCLTVSSTVAIETLVRGIPTRLILDFGIDDHLGTHYFAGSGCLAMFADVTPDMPFVMNAGWFDRHAAAPRDRYADLVARLTDLLAEQDQRGSALPLRDMTPFSQSGDYRRFAAAFRAPGLTRSLPAYWLRYGLRLARAAVLGKIRPDA